MDRKTTTQPNQVNDLFFIKYEAKRMLVDSLDMPRDVELAHRRLCDFIWSLDRCPQDDDSVLMGICRVEAANWARVKGGLNLKGWNSKGGFFEHGGALKTLHEARDEHDRRVKQTAAAREARIVSKTVTSPVTESVTDVQSQSQSESQSEQQPLSKESVGDVVKEVSSKLTVGVEPFDYLRGQLTAFYKRPANSPLSYAEQSLLSEISRRPDCKEEWREIQGFAARGDRRYFPQTMSRLIERWHEVLDRARNYVAGPAPLTGADKVALNDELRRALAERDSIRGTYQGHQTWTERDKNRVGELNARIKEVKAALGVKI